MRCSRLILLCTKVPSLPESTSSALVRHFLPEDAMNTYTSKKLAAIRSSRAISGGSGN